MTAAGVRELYASVTHVEAVSLSVEPLDMRGGSESALARAAAVFGAARPHTAYLFANRRANRMKVLVRDGIGVWPAKRRLNTGKFAWPRDATGTVTLSGWHGTLVCDDYSGGVDLAVAQNPRLASKSSTSSCLRALSGT